MQMYEERTLVSRCFRLNREPSKLGGLCCMDYFRHLTSSFKKHQNKKCRNEDPKFRSELFEIIAPATFVSVGPVINASPRISKNVLGCSVEGRFIHHCERNSRSS